MKRFAQLAVALVLLLSLWGIASLSKAQSVTSFRACFNVRPGTAPVCDFQPDMPAFAAWSWSERTGMLAQYHGDAADICQSDDSITYLEPSKKEWGALAERTTLSSTALAASFRCKDGEGWFIAFNPSVTMTRLHVLHELGHPLTDDVIHTYGDPYAVMSSGAAVPLLDDAGNVVMGADGKPVPVQVEKLLTTTDILFALANPHPRWLRVQAPSFCHVELAPDYDLMIPEINGRRALLNYTGVVSGFHTWTIAYLNTAPSLQGCTNNTTGDGTITLTDIRGQYLRFASATLQTSDGVTWRLAEAQPAAGH